MELAARIGMMARRGENPLVQWTDGNAIVYGGVLSGETNWSASDFIPVPPSHNISVKTGFVALEIQPTVRIYGYDSAFKALNVDRHSVSPSGTTTFTLSLGAVYIRSSCPTANKLTFSIYDNTDGRYIVKDGLLLVPNEGGGTKCLQHSFNWTRKEYDFWRP